MLEADIRCVSFLLSFLSLSAKFLTLIPFPSHNHLVTLGKYGIIYACFLKNQLFRRIVLYIHIHTGVSSCRGHRPWIHHSGSGELAVVGTRKWTWVLCKSRVTLNVFVVSPGTYTHALLGQLPLFVLCDVKIKPRDSYLSGLFFLFFMLQILLCQESSLPYSP